MFCKAFLVLTFMSWHLASAARISRSTASLQAKSNGTDSTTGGGTCTITEVDGHVKYGITFAFKPETKCNRASCNAFKFLDDTVTQMMHAYPDYEGVQGTCGCFVKEGPLSTSPDQHFLLSFDQLKIFQCNPEMCWDRYAQMVSLGMKAEHGSIDWPRTQDIESRNHWKAECTGGSGTTTNIDHSVLPTAHDIIKKLKEEGKTDGVDEILEIVNDKEEVAAGNGKRKGDADEKAKKQVFITDVDDVDDSKHHRMIAFVDKPTDLRDVVVLSPSHGICAKDAVKFTRLSADDVTCEILRTADDCGLAADLLRRNLGDHEGPSEIFNDMTPPEHEADQFFASAFKVRALKRYPPACFGRITGIGGQMHTSWNPLMPTKGNKEKKAKKSKGNQVVQRIICGCYDK